MSWHMTGIYWLVPLCKVEMPSIVTYLRVSRESQGRSGLGLEAQRETIKRFAEAQKLEIAAEYIDVETGKGSDALDKRHNLNAAFITAKGLNCPIVVAKLDRLSRDVHFISGLMSKGTNFIVAEMPDADPFMLHIYAAFAEKERSMISVRTKEAMARAKERGVRLGPSAERCEADRKAAIKRARDLAPTFAQVAHLAAHSAAKWLNNHGIASHTGANWSAKTVLRVRARLEMAE